MFENYDNFKVDSLNMQSIKGCLQNKSRSISKYMSFETTLDKTIYGSWR